MKRAFLVVISMIILVLFLSGSAGANLITRGGFAAGDPAGWNTRDKREKNSFPFEPSDSAAFFGGEDTACRYDDLFTATSVFVSTATPYLNLNSMIWDVSSRNLAYETRHYHAYFSVSDLWDNDPNARMEFDLLEACVLICDHTGTWVILDTVLVEADPAPVPEPGTILLIGSGLVSAGLISRMRRRKNLDRIAAGGVLPTEKSES